MRDCLIVCDLELHGCEQVRFLSKDIQMLLVLIIWGSYQKVLPTSFIGWIVTSICHTVLAGSRIALSISSTTLEGVADYKISSSLDYRSLTSTRGICKVSASLLIPELIGHGRWWRHNCLIQWRWWNRNLRGDFLICPSLLLFKCLLLSWMDRRMWIPSLMVVC